MKIGLITYHASRSYGAFFQCYATLKALQSLGYEVEIIDYRNIYEQTYLRIKKFDYNTIKRAIKIIIKNCIYGMGRLEKRAFGRVVDMYGGAITSKRYSNVEDMSELEYDCLIIGSDQMWNLEISGGIDKAFLLEFGKAKKRISFATSMGSYNLTDDECVEFKKGLQNIECLSVREKFAKEQLESLINKNIEVVADPTILLKKEEWKSLMAIGIKGEICKPFILTFFVGGNYKAYKDRINRLTKKYNLPIYCIQSSKIRVCENYNILAGINPAEFLYLINSAEFFITDSFHGTCFALYFEKDFIVLSNKNNPYRTKELMNELELDDRVDPEDINLLSDIEYDKVNNKLEKMRKHSLDWLKGALNE